MATWGQSFLAVALIFVCLFLILVILLQKGRGGGLAGAFGGGGGGSSAFGAKTGDVFTWITVVVAGVFLLLSVVANFAFDATPPPRELPAVSVVPDVPDQPVEETAETVPATTGIVLPSSEAKPESEKATAEGDEKKVDDAGTSEPAAGEPAGDATTGDEPEQSDGNQPTP